jgi:hypothetical protein
MPQISKDVETAYRRLQIGRVTTKPFYVTIRKPMNTNCESFHSLLFHIAIISNFPTKCIYTFEYLYCFTKCLLYVLALTVPSSGRTLCHFSKPSAYCKVTMVDYRAWNKSCGFFLQSCLQLLKQYWPIMALKSFLKVLKTLS